MTALSVVKRAAPAARAIFPGCQVYLFGSYAWGEPDEMSDIDMAVILEKDDVPADPDEYLDMRINLMDACYDVDDRIEPTVRMVPDRTGFVKMILNEGIRVA